MYSKTMTPPSTTACSEALSAAKRTPEEADALLIGAGSGLSASVGLTYSGPRFQAYFGDFIRKYGIQDLYSGGFYPFETPEEYWAWWSWQIWINRYEKAPQPVYELLLELDSVYTSNMV